MVIPVSRDTLAGSCSVFHTSLKLWKIRLRYGKLTTAVSYRCCSELCSFAAELSDTVVDFPIFYYHSTTIHCRDLPRFAGLARISGRNVRFSQSANRGKTSPCEALEAYEEDFVCVPRQYFLSIGFYATGGALIAAKRGRQKANYYCFTTFGEIKKKT